jgi:hypothetical protein
VVSVSRAPYLDSLQDLAELKLVLVLDSGQAENRGGLLVNNLQTVITQSEHSFLVAVTDNTEVQIREGKRKYTDPRRDFPLTMQYGTSIFLQRAGSHTTSSIGSTSWAMTTSWALLCSKIRKKIHHKIVSHQQNCKP